jgi:ABC-type branched-subunit amino acid transport system substrate-binding protein
VSKSLNAAIGTTAALAVAALVAATVSSPASGAGEARACSFQLRMGTVLPFTGDLAAYGANLDRAVKLGVELQSRALRSGGLSSSSVTLVASEDGETQARASVEAATKLVKTDRVSVVIGEMASTATIPMARSVTVPNRIVQISPTSSAPQLTTLKDRGFLWRAYPSDALQGRVLGQAALAKFGRGAIVNVGSRNDAFGTALRQLFVAQWRALGGKVGTNISWNPTQPSFDTEAQQLVEGDPAGWVIIDFPDTFQKFAPSLVRSGAWSADKTLMTEALRNTEVLSKIGDPVKGLSGTAASAAGGPAGKSFAAYWKKNVTGAKPYTGFEGTALDAANVAFLAAVKACSASPSRIRANLRSVSGPPGAKVTFQTLGRAVRMLRAGRDVDYEGTFSPVDFDRNGDIGSAVFEIWRYDGGEKISTLRTVTFRG